MLDRLNIRVQKLMPVLTPCSLIVGVILEDIGRQLLFLVPWLFAFMTFAGSLSMNFKDVKSFSRYPKTILFTIAFLHIIMPLWAYLLSTLIFHDHLLTLGFIISVAVPTAVTSVIWTTVSRGNLPLSLAIVLIDTLISPIIVPAIMHFVAGQSVTLDTRSLILDLLWMIVLPSLLGVLLNELTKGGIQKTLGRKLAPFSKMCIFGVVMINSSAVAPYVKDINRELLQVILTVLLLSASGYTLAFLLGRLIWKDPGIATTFVFVGGMRNIAVGVIIATTYFPARVAMPVVFGMLFQQVLASLFSRIVEKYNPPVEEQVPASA